MIYLSSFKLSDRKVNNPNIYPYNVFRDKYIEPFVFSTITVFYGNNGSGKSTLLNIIANCLELKGKEYATHSPFMLGTLNAKIYNLDTEEYDVTKWSDLDNVRYFYNFFKKHENEIK